MSFISKFNLPDTRSRRIICSTSGLLLVIAGVCNVVVPGFNWGVFDFIFAGIFFLIVGTTVAIIHGSLRGHKAIEVSLIALALLLFAVLWAEMAVGLIGTPLAGD